MKRYIPAALLCILGLLPATLAQAPPGPLANQSGPSAPASVPASGTLRFLATDKDGHPVTDLKVEDLRIRVNKQERKIFSVSHAPDSSKTIGVFFDVSGSRRKDELLDKEVQSISRFLESVWHPGDAGFVVIFADRPATLAKPSGDLRQLVESMKGVLTAEYRGSTALRDALCSGHFREPQAGRGERLFLVVSDFGDNSSRQTEEDMIRTLREEGVRVFALLRQDTLNKPAEHRRSTKAATQAAQKTGGDVLRVDNEKDLDKGLERLASELQGSYRMDYEPGTGVATQERLQIESTRPNVTLLYPRD